MDTLIRKLYRYWQKLDLRPS